MRYEVISSLEVRIRASSLEDEVRVAELREVRTKDEIARILNSQQELIRSGKYKPQNMSARMRVTRAHTGNRRSHHALKEPRLSTCTKCNAQHLRHRMCPTCGSYRGREVIDVAAKTVARATRRQERLKAMGEDPSAEEEAHEEPKAEKKEAKKSSKEEKKD